MRDKLPVRYLCGGNMCNGINCDPIEYLDQFYILRELFSCVADPSGELHRLWSPGLLHASVIITKIKAPLQKLNIIYWKQFTTKQHKYGKKYNEWVPCEILMFPLNILLHGWPLPADPTWDGLHADSHWSPDGQDLAALCSSACLQREA